MPSTTSASAAHASGTSTPRSATLARQHRGGEHASAPSAACRRGRALAEHEQPIEHGAVVERIADQRRQRDRQVEPAADLAQIGRCQVDRHALERQVVAARAQRAANSHAALFHRRCGEPDDAVRRQLTGVHDALDVDADRVNPDKRARGDERDHAWGKSTSRANANRAKSHACMSGEAESRPDSAGRRTTTQGFFMWRRAAPQHAAAILSQ